jgi:cytochrome d ubiquinol oxidase subunit I
MEMTSFFDVVFNSVAQAKFVHTVSAGYVTAAVFVLGVSAWYMLKGRHIELARRSLAVAASFGLASAFSVVLLGDESGYAVTHDQKMKLAAIEGMWETEPAPASFTLFGFPDQQARETHYAVKIPIVMGLIGTRSLTTPIPGIDELEKQAEQRIRSGMLAYDALIQIREAKGATTPEMKTAFEEHSADLGFAMLLKRYVDDPRQATDDDIVKAAHDTIPTVWPLFWSFRVMVALGFAFIAVLGWFFYQASFRGMRFSRTALWFAVIIIPTPWIAAELGWFVAEYGRQPWVVDSVLPTALAVSHLSVLDLLITLAGFVAFYTVLFIIEMGLMFKYIRKGPFMDVDETDNWMRKHQNRLASGVSDLQPAE